MEKRSRKIAVHREITIVTHTIEADTQGRGYWVVFFYYYYFFL